MSKKTLLIFSFYTLILLVVGADFFHIYLTEKKVRLKLAQEQNVAVLEGVDRIVSDHVKIWERHMTLLANSPEIQAFVGANLKGSATKEQTNNISSLLQTYRELTPDAKAIELIDLSKGASLFIEGVSDVGIPIIQHASFILEDLKTANSKSPFAPNFSTYHNETSLEWTIPIWYNNKVIGGLVFYFGLQSLWKLLKSATIENVADSVFFVQDNGQLIIPDRKQSLLLSQVLDDPALEKEITQERPTDEVVSFVAGDNFVSLGAISQAQFGVMAVTKAKSVLDGLYKDFKPLLINFFIAVLAISLFSFIFLRLLNNTLRKTTVSRDYLDAIMRSMEGMVLVLDDHLYIRHVNYAVCKTLGYEEQELLGKLYDVLLANESSSIKENLRFKDLLKSGEVQDREVEYHSKEGAIIPVLLSTSMLKGKNSKEVEFICVAQDIREQKKSEEKLRFIAEHDALTQLYNRVQFNQALNHELARAVRNKSIIAILLLDLDNFKDINDTFGHEVGDKLLVLVSERLREATRQSDILARLGGDEFIGMVAEIKEVSEAGIIAEKLNKLIARPYSINGHTIYTSASIGIACHPQNGNEASELIKNADVAMYLAKQEGRNTYRYYTRQLQEAHAAEMELIASLHEAIRHNEFSMVYQPIVDLKTRKPVSMEALIRWRSENLGVVSPTVFIPIAETRGKILEVGGWALDTVCKQIKLWKGRGYHYPISINISPKQLKDPTFRKEFVEKLTEYHLSTSDLKLELTEMAIGDQSEKPGLLLDLLKEMGAEVLLDDFGTGFSSLSRIRTPPITALKIDKSFVQGLQTTLESQAIICSTIALAKSLGIKTIGEGIETEKQLDFLFQNGCDYGQGYLFNKPLAPADLEEYLSLFENED